MSYRSIKKYLGETNIERKCRILFGVCLSVLIFAAFLWVDWIAEDVVKQTIQSRGRSLVDTSLLAAHFQFMPESRSENPDGWKQLHEQFRKDLTADSFPFETLALVPEDYQPVGTTTDNPGDALEEQTSKQDTVSLLPWIEAQRPNTRERAALQELEAALKEVEMTSTVEENAAGSDDTTIERASVLNKKVNPIFAEQHVNENGKNDYHYYEPIYWQDSCKSCHKTLVDAGAFPAADQEALPLHAIKVTIPYEQTQHALNKTRAILTAMAVVTVFIAMVGLYIIVRYVIVKPLKHLRDVSDEISQGNTEFRADLNTGDEFQELADSFNRMLHHLVDAHAELRDVNSALDAKVDQLAQLNMRLHEMNQIKSEFLANMSHELRTPLNSIIGFSEVLQSIKTLDDRQKRYAENIQKSGRVLLEMINDILDLAKMEAGRMELRPLEFNVSSVIHAHCDMVRALSEEKNIDVNVDVDKNLPAIYQDQTKVQQILTNLLSNAIKFTPEGGRIDVAARKTTRDQFELVVADTGVGIAQDDLEVIFEKFRQGKSATGEDTLTREYSGTGLGLSIVRELCKLMGGSVSVESELGKGSTFKMLLPWICDERNIHHTEVELKLDALTAPKRLDFRRAQEEAETPLAPTSTTTVVDERAEV